ncbi:putative phage abortive infection protein [Pedobacter agri]|uniref:putative phage abortive infection protein n=1 Tax=Pedobacter agri TaxID=454586 RepID=UPI00292F35AA|nr:putative phage abortive infection protein [Pedobacter agri]
MSKSNSARPGNRASLTFNQWLLLIFFILFVCVAWIINANNVYDEHGNDLGVYGDKFGAVNALFSGLAFAGIIFTIMLQSNELAMQREESKAGRKEFVQQNFETTFFNLLNNQQSLLMRIKGSTQYINQHTTDVSTRRVTDVLFFIMAKGEISRIMKALQYKNTGMYDYDYFSSIPPDEYEEDEVSEDYVLAVHSYTNFYYNLTPDIYTKAEGYSKKDFIRLAYVLFFRKNQHLVGHYFRHLYHIFKFLNFSETEELSDADSAEEKEKIKHKYQTYAEFVQAQMTAPELFLLYYNCLAFEKMKDLVVKYGVLSNLNLQDLIAEDNSVLEGVSLRDKADLMNF